MHRLDLLRKTVRRDAVVMVDANEAWSAKEAAAKIGAMRDAGHNLLWVEDPILRHDFEGLRLLRESLPWTMINSGEYLDVAGKRQIMLAGGTDILNVYGQVTDVMRIGWLRSWAYRLLGEYIPGDWRAHGLRLPEVQWLEYSFQNFDHLVDEPILIRDGVIHAPERPGHGLVLSQVARREWARPDVVANESVGAAPVNRRVSQPQGLKPNAA